MIYDEFEMEKSVKLAADVLDVMYPQWMEAIKLDRLVMEDSESCILGQLAGSMNNEFTYGSNEKFYEDLYQEVADSVNDSEDVLVAFDLDASEAGFEAAYRHDGWRTLGEVWKKAIRERQ